MTGENEAGQINQDILRKDQSYRQSRRETSRHQGIISETKELASVYLVGASNP